MISDWVTMYTHINMTLLILKTDVTPYCFNVNTTVFKISSDVHCAHMNNAKD